MNAFSYRIYYEDTDAGGVVYYANYLKFLERARTDLLLSRGILQSYFIAQNIFFIVKKCEIEYTYSAKLEDIITVSCEIKDFGKTFINFLQVVTVGERLIAKAIVQVVCVKNISEKFKPHKIPDRVLSIIK